MYFGPSFFIFLLKRQTFKKERRGGMGVNRGSTYEGGRPAHALNARMATRNRQKMERNGGRSNQNQHLLRSPRGFEE